MDLTVLDLNIDALPASTRRLWSELKTQRLLNGFVLVGGTALALRMGHRLSEHLDFIWPEKKLPRERLKRLVKEITSAQGSCVPIDPIEGLREFEDTGFDYHDFQQDYLVGGTVKITFLAPDPDVLVHLHAPCPAALRVAEPNEIFAMKALLSADRSKSRDWFDLYVLMKKQGFSADNFREVFVQSKVATKLALALSRLCDGKLASDDEGFQAHLQPAPTVAELQHFFRDVRNQIEVEIAREKSLAGRPTG